MQITEFIITWLGSYLDRISIHIFTSKQLSCDFSYNAHSNCGYLLLVGKHVALLMFLICFYVSMKTFYSNWLPAALYFCFVVCRNRVISCPLSCVWSKKYCLWGWIHCVVIFCWRSYYTVWFVDTFGFLFSWLLSQFFIWLCGSQI